MPKESCTCPCKSAHNERPKAKLFCLQRKVVDLWIRDGEANELRYMAWRPMAANEKTYLLIRKTPSDKYCILQLVLETYHKQHVR